ncbi:MAG TPA: hypothetical protein PK636_04800 [bacterium]|nr:hypothetical protein [bacterium]
MPLRVLLAAAAVWTAGAPAARACLICEASTHKSEDELRARIQEHGREMIPELRSMVACRHAEHRMAKILAIDTLAGFEDRESIPEFRRLVLELLDPASPSTFGPFAVEAEIRGAAARALGELEVTGVGDLVWEARDRLPPVREAELPRIFKELREPESMERLESLLWHTRNRQTAFQVIIQFREIGRRAQIPPVRARLDSWEEELARLKQSGGDDYTLGRMVRYTGQVLAVMEGRR